MRRLRALGLLGWGICIVTILSLAAFAAVYGKDGWQQQAIWFLFYNVAGYALLFAAFLLHEVWRAPGPLLERDLMRGIALEYAQKVSARLLEGNRLLERIRLDGYSAAVRESYETWADNCRCELREQAPQFEAILDDQNMDGLGSLFDVQVEMSAAPWRKRTPEQEQRDVLLDLVRRKCLNLQRIYEYLAPITVSGEKRPNRSRD